MIVILSKASCQSKWVKEELTLGKLQEIEKQRVKVLPVIIETCEIPTSLKTKYYADLTSWQDGLKRFLASLQNYDFERKIKGENQLFETKQYSFEKIQEFYIKQKEITLKYGWDTNEGYKDIIFGPPNDTEVSIKKTRILEIIGACRIRLKRWGGAPFPYDDLYPTVEKYHIENGITIVDKGEWPFSDWSFN